MNTSTVLRSTIWYDCYAAIARDYTLGASMLSQFLVKAPVDRNIEAAGSHSHADKRSRTGTTTARSISLKSSLIHHLMHHVFVQAQHGRFGWTDRRVPYQDDETEAGAPLAVCVDPASVYHKPQP